MRRPDLMKQKLIEGLEQAEVDCFLPQVTIHKSFQQFIKYDIFCQEFIKKDNDNDNHLKFITQPLLPKMIKKNSDTGLIEELPLSVRFSNIFQQHYHHRQHNLLSSSISPSLPTTVTIVIGPEGGWMYEELESFVQLGFHQVHMGTRILRTDIAVQSALGIVNELLGYYDTLPTSIASTTDGNDNNNNNRNI